MSIQNFAKGNLSIGFVVSHPFYGSPGSIVRIKELSTSLSAFGAKVHVYSPFSGDESWGKNVFFHKIPSIVSTLGLQNVQYRLTRWALNKPFFVRRIVSKTVLDKTISSFAKNLKTTITEDLDIIQGEQEIAAAACVQLREELGVPVIASLHNIWPEELITTGLIGENSGEYALLQESEKKTVFGSDLNVVVSEEMAIYLKEKYSLSNDRILIIPPGGRARVNQISKIRGKQFKVVFAGLVAKRANLDLFIKSMPYVLEKYPDTQFFITNKGEDLKRIRKLTHELSVNPRFYWFPESADFYKFLSSCHVGVVTSSNDLPRRMGPSVKLFDYISVGLPVVANNIGGWTKIVENSAIGILTDSDPECFAQGILKLLDDQELSCNFGENGLNLVNSKYSWTESARALFEGYKGLLK